MIYFKAMDSERLDIEKALSAFTIEEKLRMLSGDGMWHTYGAGEIPRVKMSDGPNGLRMVDGASAVPSTCYPTASMLANSWDPALLYSIGSAMGREATALGVNLLLAPGINIKRHPLCGRNFEYYSEDPILAGTLAKAFVGGVQSTGVGACVKHFAANNQEAYRMYSDSIVDMRALRELYLKPFELAAKAEPAALMCAYNKLNGHYCSESEFLLKQVLRDDWGYRGVTLSDWGAVRSRTKSLCAGLDLEMPSSGGIFSSDLRLALKTGAITEGTIDESLRRTLELVDNVYLEPYGDFDADAHDKLCYAAAVDSIVLLRNDNGFLPLTKNMKIAVIGELASSAPIQGGGSSHVTPFKAVSPLDAFAERGVEVTYCRGYSDNAKENRRLFDEAMNAANDTDAVIVYVGQSVPTEGIDRFSLDLPTAQDELINALSGAGHRVVVVLAGAGPVKMPWVKRVKAILYQGLCGQVGALAAIDILFGRVNPRGRLAETFPIDDAELGSDFGGLRTVYRESLFVGYKYYDAIKRRVMFPFGHGLSFSDISYDELHVKRLGNNEFTVEITLTNNSVRDAYETVQVYVSDRTGRVLRPEKQLEGYKKVFIEGKSTAVVEIKLDKSAFEFWNEEKHAFSLCDGEYRILVGASASDIKKEMSVKIDGDFTGRIPYPEAYKVPVRAKLTDEDFAVLYGAPVPPETPRPVKGEHTLDSCVADISSCLAGKILASKIKRGAKKVGKKGSVEYESNLHGGLYTPLSAMASMWGPDMPKERALGIVLMANGHFFRGLKTMLKKKKYK